jgi:hypothetical protein
MKQKTLLYILIGLLIVLGLLGIKEGFTASSPSSKASVSDFQSTKARLEALIPKFDIKKYPTTVAVGPIMAQPSSPQQIAQRFMDADKASLTSKIRLLTDLISMGGKAPAGPVPQFTTGYLNALVDYWTKKVNDPKTKLTEPDPRNYPAKK